MLGAIIDDIAVSRFDYRKKNERFLAAEHNKMLPSTDDRRHIK